MRMRGTSDRAAFRCSCEQMTSHVRHPMQRVGSGKMTPSAKRVVRGVAALATAAPPSASRATNATIGAAPRRKSRRETSTPSDRPLCWSGPEFTAVHLNSGMARLGYSVLVGKLDGAPAFVNAASGARNAMVFLALQVGRCIHVASHSRVVHVEVDALVLMMVDHVVQVRGRGGR